MLRVEGLTVRYGHVSAVRELSFQVGEGEVVCLVGSNGAGKSSTLKALMGLLPAHGQICLGDRDIAGYTTPSRVAAGMALVPEGRHVFPELSVHENLRLGFRSSNREEQSRRLDGVLQFFPRLKERWMQMAGTLSGGEQQMLAIGRALMSSPRILLLDEPTLGLAPVMVQRVAEVIRKLREGGVGVLLSEQNLSMALSVSDRGYVVASGQIVTGGSAFQLQSDERVRESYLGESPVVSQVV